MEQSGFRPDQKQALAAPRSDGSSSSEAGGGFGAGGLKSAASRFPRSNQREVSLNWNMSIRQIHRWLSIAFTLAVIVNVIAMMQEKQAVWVGLLALFPLILLLAQRLCTCSRCPMPPNGAAREASADRCEANGRQDLREIGEGRKEAGAKPVLLSGGNPQIAKGDGDAPVQAYIAAMPGWKRDVGRHLDALIVRTVPACARPSNGIRPSMASRIRAAGSSAFHCFTKYVKVTFFEARRCARSRPASPSTGKCVTSISMRATSTKSNSPPG
jgi:hypothetical protein